MEELAELGHSIVIDNCKTNFLESGVGPPVLLIHGSGPGVSAYANWRSTIPALSRHFRVIAPDMLGFGFTERRDGTVYSLPSWRSQIFGLLDGLGIARVSIVGNSFGGAVAMSVAAAEPDRVERLVLMGSVGVPFQITAGLDAVWGYEPSVRNMRQLVHLFAASPSLANDEELIALRFRASMRPGFQESYAAMFPPPRQRWVDALVTSDEELAGLSQETLIIHGRDDRVIPIQNSLHLMNVIPRSQLHVFGPCGHWTQTEWSDVFNGMLIDFLSGRMRQSSE